MRKIIARRTETILSGTYTILNKTNASGDKEIYADKLKTPI